MTTEQLEAGRRWLETRADDFKNFGDYGSYVWNEAVEEQEQALLAFLATYQTWLEADVAYDAYEGAVWTDVSVSLIDAKEARDAAWLALIGAGEKGADDE